MSRFGMIRVAAAVPVLRLADTRFNANRTIDLLHRAESQGIDAIVFPEMSLTGYTCNDLFFNRTLQDGAKSALGAIVTASARIFNGICIVGMPLNVDDQLFNVAVVINRGHVIGVVPKSYLPNYKEFYDARFFAPASAALALEVELLGQKVSFGTDQLFRTESVPGLALGVEICEDLWCPVPPSSLQCYHGANIIVNLSASNETIGKAAYRRQLVAQQSARCIAGYVYSAAGIGESTTDIVFGGHSFIAENGTILAEAPRFARDDVLIVSEIDLERLSFERSQTTSFADAANDMGLRRYYRPGKVELTQPDQPFQLNRFVDAHPFVPRAGQELKARCEEIFNIQVNGLARRLEQIGNANYAIGVSGGLDSTLALLVLCKTIDLLKLPKERVKALTMPGFGTTGRTLNNAKKLMADLGISYREIDIRPIAFAEMQLLGHAPFGIDLGAHTVDTLTEQLRHIPKEKRHDLTFENVQARARTSLLMNTAFVIGTGDLSELALGWCTYNADHMSMYNPNVSIPKTLVKFLVDWAADCEFQGSAQATLKDIVDTVISPELLPASADGKPQSTESTIGPYELHDFFLFCFLRYGMTPPKILYLASQAKFNGQYTAAEIKGWLKVFIRRFFMSQFKRSCIPDGPKVGSVSLSPRGDWRMPSDAQANLWLESLE